MDRFAVFCGVAAMFLTSLASAQAAAPATPGQVHYEPTVASLKRYEAPEWFQDGKLGIFMHWGPESIPGVVSCWYARRMYQQGDPAYNYHCATYGHPSKSGYKDLVKLFTAPKFDQAQADRLVKLYKQAGARYVVPVAVHHDNFDMWDSKYQPRFNSVVTSRKDVVGMWQAATVKEGLHFGVASRVARTYRWFQTSHGSDKTGPLAGVPYDGQDPAFADLYGVPWNSDDPGYEGPQDVGPPEFEKQFENRMKDLIDKYHPDLYYIKATGRGPSHHLAGWRGSGHGCRLFPSGLHRVGVRSGRREPDRNGARPALSSNRPQAERILRSRESVRGSCGGTNLHERRHVRLQVPSHPRHIRARAVVGRQSGQPPLSFRGSGPIPVQRRPAQPALGKQREYSGDPRQRCLC